MTIGNTIPASQIVSVTPNVLSAGGGALALSGLVLTKSTRVPIGQVLSFPDAPAVEDYFGPNAIESNGAPVYFAGFDGSNVKPGALLMAQYPTAAVSAWLRGGDISGLALSALQALSGTISVVVDGYTWTSPSINLSSATSFSSAAAIIQTGLQTSPPTAASVTGSISGNTLTVSAVASGNLAVGQTISGAGVAAGTIITALDTGTGGTGTYTVNNSQTVASETLTASGTAPTVTYDTIAGAFVITSGITGAPSSIAFPTTNSFVTSLMLTQATGAVLSQGAAAATPANFMDSIVAQTTNWATFMTAFDPDNGSGNVQKFAFATWNGQQDDEFGYVCWDDDITPTESTNATSSLGQLIKAAGISGTCLVYEPSNLYHAWFICGSAASIDFTEKNGRITFAFKSQSGLTASVTNGTVAQNLIANGYNFYGAYADADDEFVFFYPGSVSGPYLWLDSYINQIWLNAAFQQAMLTLLTNTKSVPYVTPGYALIRAACLDPIKAGLNFGAFSPGVTLSTLQAAEINNAAGLQISGTIQTQGYYLQILPASAQARGTRSTPPMTFWYADAGAVQKLNLASVEIQ